MEAGSAVSFRGPVARSASQAFFLTFCAGIALVSLVLVFQIKFQELVLPGVGQTNYFVLTLLAPCSSVCYRKSGDRVDEIKVKLASDNKENLHDVVIEANEQ